MSVINLREYMKRVYTELENYIEGLSEEDRVRFVTEFHDMFDSGTADYDDEHITALYVMKTIGECPMQRECWAKHREVSLIIPE